MTVYLGNLGQLVPIKCPSSQGVEPADSTTFETTLEGRVRAQTRAVNRRAWGIQLGAATPADLASILAFNAGEFGKGPFVWVSADAPVTNMLTPEVSTCGPEAAAATTSATVAGPLSVAGEGLAGRSLSNSNTGVNMYFGNIPVPVIPGEKITASAGLLGLDAQMGVGFYTAAGSLVSAALSSAKGVASEARRLSITATVPASAAYCLPYGVKTTRGARPAVTWTDQVFAWQPGEGCAKAVLTGVSKDVILALRTPGQGRYANLTATITEVG